MNTLPHELLVDVLKHVDTEEIALLTKTLFIASQFIVRQRFICNYLNTDVPKNTIAMTKHKYDDEDLPDKLMYLNICNFLEYDDDKFYSYLPRNLKYLSGRIGFIIGPEPTKLTDLEMKHDIWNYANVEIPQTVTRLRFSYDLYNIPKIPSSVKYLKIGNINDDPFVGFPISLTHLVLREDFNANINVWPNLLYYLKIKGRYFKKISQWPYFLTYLEVCHHESIHDIKCWPIHLTHLSISIENDSCDKCGHKNLPTTLTNLIAYRAQSIKMEKLPHLNELSLRYLCNLAHNWKLPTSIKKLSLRSAYVHDGIDTKILDQILDLRLTHLCLPETSHPGTTAIIKKWVNKFDQNTLLTLTHLSITDENDYNLKFLPLNITHLIWWNYYQSEQNSNMHDLKLVWLEIGGLDENDVLPKTLIYLIILNCNVLPIFPKSLKCLDLRHYIGDVLSLPKLTHLKLDKTVNEVVFPSSLVYLRIQQKMKNTVPKHIKLVVLF